MHANGIITLPHACSSHLTLVLGTTPAFQPASSLLAQHLMRATAGLTDSLTTTHSLTTKPPPTPHHYPRQYLLPYPPNTDITFPIPSHRDSHQCFLPQTPISHFPIPITVPHNRHHHTFLPRSSNPSREKKGTRRNQANSPQPPPRRRPENKPQCPVSCVETGITPIGLPSSGTPSHASHVACRGISVPFPVPSLPRPDPSGRTTYAIHRSLAVCSSKPEKCVGECSSLHMACCTSDGLRDAGLPELKRRYDSCDFQGIGVLPCFARAPGNPIQGGFP